MQIKTEQAKEGNLFEMAAFSSDHTRRDPEEEDYRPPYKRDVDRIIHSKAYARYGDKTQVIYLIEKDHVAQRALHVQLVSNFSRGIAEMLQLNGALVEAIALGHDVGHPPFGHEGEHYLSDLSIAQGHIPFCHPWQSCRLFSEIENLNLGLFVLDGFLCHDGGLQSPILEPRFGKTWSDFERDKEQKLLEPNGNIFPATLEGCLVKLCDTISYLGRDLEDAIHLGIIERSQVPPLSLGVTNREFLKNAAMDIITTSQGKPWIEISEQGFAAIQTLREFNFTHIYHHPKLKRESARVKRGYQILFLELLEDLKIKGENSQIWRDYVKTKPSKYQKETVPVQMVIDYIAGMTNKYFLRTLESLILPKQIEWTL